MENEQGFFDFAAYVGLTKHLGGVAATDDLVELCHIGEGRYVLDVGCGACTHRPHVGVLTPRARGRMEHATSEE